MVVAKVREEGLDRVVAVLVCFFLPPFCSEDQLLDTLGYELNDTCNGCEPFLTSDKEEEEQLLQQQRQQKRRVV